MEKEEIMRISDEDLINPSHLYDNFVQLAEFIKDPTTHRIFMALVKIAEEQMSIRDEIIKKLSS